MPRPPTPALFQPIGQSPENDCEMLSFLAKHGPVVRTSPFRSQYLINDPAAIDQILRTDAQHYNKDRVAIQRLGQMVGQGLITHSDQAWRDAKQRVHHAFSPKTCEPLLAPCHAIVQHHLTDWPQNHTPIEHDVVPSCLAMALELNATMLSGLPMRADPKAFTARVTRAVASGCRAWSFAPWVPSLRRWHFHYLAQPLHAWANQMIDDMLHQPADARTGLLTPLMDAFHEGRIDRATLQGEFKTYLFAGYEATGMAMAWLLHHMASDTACMQRMRDEYTQVAPAQTALSLAQMKQLTYTDQVIAESLRLSPPVFVMERRAKIASQLCGYDLPKDALLIISPYLIHRHPTYWPQPTIFNPARFDLPATERPKGSYIPYGFGPRTCIGMQLGQLLLKTMLGPLLHTFSFARSTRPITLGMGQITLKPKHGIWLQIEKR